MISICFNPTNMYTLLHPRGSYLTGHQIRSSPKQLKRTPWTQTSRSRDEYRADGSRVKNKDAEMGKQSQGSRQNRIKTIHSFHTCTIAICWVSVMCQGLGTQPSIQRDFRLDGAYRVVGRQILHNRCSERMSPQTHLDAGSGKAPLEDRSLKQGGRRGERTGLTPDRKHSTGEQAGEESAWLAQGTAHKWSWSWW